MSNTRATCSDASLESREAVRARRFGRSREARRKKKNDKTRKRKNARLRFAAAAVSVPPTRELTWPPRAPRARAFSSHVRASSPCVTLGRAHFAGCSPVVLDLLAFARARGRGASRAALVRRALRLTATQVLELYQIAPFVLQLDARAAPVTVRVGDGKQVSGVFSTSSRGVRVQAPPGALRGAPRAPPSAHSPREKRVAAKNSSRASVVPRH